jgi:hypothetical protein
VTIVVARDVDADGSQDVSLPTSSGLLLLRGAASVGFSQENVVQIALQPAQPVAYAWANLDMDAELELVRASDTALESYDFPQFSSEVSPEPAPLPGDQGESLSALPGAAALLSGDATGDGIDDLVLDASGLWLLIGQPVLQ